MKTAIIMLGPPGAGKGTQARLLSESFNLAHIATGYMLRTAIKEGTEEGGRAKTFIEAGLLVPDELVEALVYERVKQPDCYCGFIFDGYPRTLTQADTLQKYLEQDDTPTLTIGISIPGEVLITRLGSRWMCPNCNRTFSEQLSSGTVNVLLCDKCGVDLIHRVDDTIEVVTERLKIYWEQTSPLIRYYEDRGTYMPVDGDQQPAKIFYAIRDTIKERMNFMPAEKKE